MANRIVSVDETFSFPPSVRARLADDLGGTAPAQVLGMAVHNPTDQQEYVNANGTTVTALAPATLAVSFIAPASGKVTVKMEAEVVESAGIGFWAVISNGAVIDSTVTHVCSTVTPSAGRARHGVTVLAEALNPGQSYTFQWATAATGTFRIRAGGTGIGTARAGAAVMVVEDAPF